MRLYHELWTDSAQRGLSVNELTLLFSLPLAHPLRERDSLPGHPGHYSVPVHLSALPLVGRVSVSEGPLKDLVGVSVSPEPLIQTAPQRDDLIASFYPQHRPHPPPVLLCRTPTRPSIRPAHRTRWSAPLRCGRCQISSSESRLLGGYLPMKLLPEAPDALLQLGWGQGAPKEEGEERWPFPHP